MVDLEKKQNENDEINSSKPGVPCLGAFASGDYPPTGLSAKV
jgi:hypothetical protein